MDGPDDDVLAGADVAVSTVPEHPGWTAFLDPALLPPHAFVAAVDLGRSWLSSAYGEFAVVATDDIAQSRTLVAEGRLKSPPDFAADLASLASGAYAGGVPRTAAASSFFSGHVLGDLAVAAARSYRRALEQRSRRQPAAVRTSITSSSPGMEDQNRILR